MPEPAVFIIVAVLAVVCAAIPFLYWHIKSRRSPTSQDSTDRITPIMRRLEAGGLAGSLTDKAVMPQLPGAAGLVGLGLGGKPVSGQGSGVPTPPRRAGSGSGSSTRAGSGSGSGSGSAYAASGSGPSSARQSTSRSHPPPAPAPPSNPLNSSAYTPATASPTQPYSHPARPARPRDERQPSGPASEAPPAYEDVVDR